MKKMDSLSVGMSDLILCCRWETCGDPLSVLSYCERPNTAHMLSFTKSQ